MSVFEFHILADVRRKYNFDESLYSTTGNVIFPNFHAVRVFAQKMNAARDLSGHPQQTIRIGQLHAMGLIDEIFHFVMRLYEENANPGVFSRAVNSLRRAFGENVVKGTLLKFIAMFPPLEVYRGTLSAKEWLDGITGTTSHLEIALEEMMLVSFANFNSAFTSFKELFDDKRLERETEYKRVITSLEKFFQKEKTFGPDNQVIFDLLRAPILASPYSLEGQLEFIKNRWGLILTKKFLDMLLRAGDIIREDIKIISLGGQAPTVVPKYSLEELYNAEAIDKERFTEDLDWMPNVVLIAKNTYVWLDQLSKKYKRAITRLDQIPDEELDQLARWNFTGLWLIGVWERSPASKTIKRMMGNPEALASAYSIYEYEIAQELGGEEALQHLRRRAWQKGIRLAGDMVPNHMGIDSTWVREHPEYFIQSAYSPFPKYQFTGPDLSTSPSMRIRIEDRYWTQQDAAIVFQRIDTITGESRYIYHGNDGTHMPWNDTAQLNFLQPEVREAVVQSILHVARKFSILRFDAAMTLTKMHYQRLWFPQPGHGGDIPSRVDYAMTKKEFDSFFPQEFWREVVDRISQEIPNTLLLAEAFWLLEGYFVRTLGMHRVYNSAFMNMLMKEENAKYRELIKNTLEFNPEILKRYVNFMSNPDEETAVEQFGKGDKYFGIALMMVTLPGLPMFAHGQIEGFSEKYGMEYKRAYYDEQPDEHFIRTHERKIFPMMRKRYLFSQVMNFELYDFDDTRGFINENVFVYSNMAGGERAIVCYHNKYEGCRGWIRRTVGKAIDGEKGEKVVMKHLAEALKLNPADRIYYI
ncbi:MAG: alpha-amylase, partial [Ignavibacteriae bacterium]|nr:alpha-amylase [Ignavibacteriota bacterium]